MLDKGTSGYDGNARHRFTPTAQSKKESYHHTAKPPLETTPTRMRSSLVEIYLHLVWGTWDRLPLLTPDLEESVYNAIRAKCHEYACPVLALGGTDDHLHLLVRAAPRLDVPALARDCKGASSHLITTTHPERFFRWQGGYGAFSVIPGASAASATISATRKPTMPTVRPCLTWNASSTTRALPPPETGYKPPVLFVVPGG